MNTFVNNVKNATNYTYTANGALAYKSTMSDLYDMFAFGGTYRGHSDEDCILLFKKAYKESPEYALKCLFYLRNILNGMGERRFFKVCLNWLAKNYPKAVLRNMEYIPAMGRWDDLYCLIDTPVEPQMFKFLKKQIDKDCDSLLAGDNHAISLCAKWLKSVNSSSKETCALGKKTAKAFGITEKQYRKVLSTLRERINVLERLMSSNKWDEIEFDKIPSKAGLKYKNAFARHDIDRMKSNKEVVSYADFAKDSSTKVNAAALYPYEIVHKAIRCKNNETDRLMIEKYWANQIDVLEGKPLKMMCVCDTSGSMTWGSGGYQPIDVAIGLSIYASERVGGPFKNKYISFASRPQFIEIEGVDFVDKVSRIYRTNLCDDTNLEATFRLLKKACLSADPEDCPESLVIISDLQINRMTEERWDEDDMATGMETIRKDWEDSGLKFPKVYYWNVNATNTTILDKGPNVSFVSGCSPILFKQIITGKTGYDLMMDILNDEIYSNIK